MIKNTAGQKIGAQLVSATDGSAFTSAVTVYVTGDAGTQAQGTVGSGACTHEGNGFHTYAPAQAETNYDHIAFTFIGTGAVPVSVQMFTNAGDAFTRLGAPAGASIAADLLTIDNLVDDLESRLGTPSDLGGGATISANLADIEAQTDDIGAAGAGLTGITAVGSVTGNVGGNVTGSIGSLAAQAKADVQAEAEEALQTYHLDHFIASADPGSVVANSSFLAKLASKSATPAFASYDNTTDSLEAIRDKETDIETDTQDIQTRVPAALVSGRIDASVGAMTSGVLTAAAIAADAITDAKVASDVTIASVTGAVGSVTGSVGSIATGGIAAASFAAGAIDAAAIAANAIGASELAADAVAELADAVWDEATSGHTTAGSYGDKIGAHEATILKAVLTSGSTTTAVVLDATTGIDGGAPSSTDDFYNGRVLIFTSGALAGQATSISDYTGSTKTLTVVALTGAPASGVTAVIV